MNELPPSLTKSLKDFESALETLENLTRQTVLVEGEEAGQVVSQERRRAEVDRKLTTAYVLNALFVLLQRLEGKGDVDETPLETIKAATERARKALTASSSSSSTSSETVKVTETSNITSPPTTNTKKRKGEEEESQSTKNRDTEKKQRKKSSS